MEFHAAANLFPSMSPEEFAALKADIEANGQREPIWTHAGKVIDGRHRFRACKDQQGWALTALFFACVLLQATLHRIAEAIENWLWPHVEECECEESDPYEEHGCPVG